MAEAEALADEDFDLESFRADSTVQDALAKGTDLRAYSLEVEEALRSVERESIEEYIGESESLAGLHGDIRACDSVLDSMELMLRGFQTDLASISAQIKYLQEESLTMNVRLRNRKAAESQLSSFIQQANRRPNPDPNPTPRAAERATSLASSSTRKRRP